MPTLKSVASVTTGEPDTFFSVIACSSVMASSLWRITSKVIGSIEALLRDWPGRGAFIVDASSQIDGEIAGIVQLRGLAGPDVDRSFRMFDDDRAGDSEAGGHFEPFKHV